MKLSSMTEAAIGSALANMMDNLSTLPESITTGREPSRITLDIRPARDEKNYKPLVTARCSLRVVITGQSNHVV